MYRVSKIQFPQRPPKMTLLFTNYLPDNNRKYFHSLQTAEKEEENTFLASAVVEMFFKM